MLITLLLILSTFFAPLTLTASPMWLQYNVQCYNIPGVVPASFTDCTNLLILMSRIPGFHLKTIYTMGARIHYYRGSCDFQLREIAPMSTVSESIRLIDYFPAFQQIGDQCLETSEGYNYGRTDVGQHFYATLGADRLFRAVENRTNAPGGNNGRSAGNGVLTA